MAENKGQIQEEVKDSTSGNQSEGKNGKEKKPKKEKKKMNLHTKLVLVEAALVLIGLGIFFILLAATDGAGGAIFGGIIAAVIFIGIAVFIARKNRFVCPKCGEILSKTGRYRETGDFSSHESGYTTTVTERVEYEYKCSRCGYTKIISKREKIGSYR